MTEFLTAAGHAIKFYLVVSVIACALILVIWLASGIGRIWRRKP